jgi:hypothetical protein
MKFAFVSIVAAASLVVGIAAQNDPQSNSSQAYVYFASEALGIDLSQPASVPNQLTSISVTSCGGANVISVTNFQLM